MCLVAGASCISLHSQARKPSLGLSGSLTVALWLESGSARTPKLQLQEEGDLRRIQPAFPLPPQIFLQMFSQLKQRSTFHRADRTHSPFILEGKEVSTAAGNPILIKQLLGHHPKQAVPEGVLQGQALPSVIAKGSEACPGRSIVSLPGLPKG